MISQRSHRDIEELLGAYALDALDDDERDLVAAHLPTCPRCRAEVEQHREVAALLANTGEPAPPELWSRISATLEGAGAAPPPPPMLASSAPRRHRPGATWPARVATGVLAAAAAVVIGVLLVQVESLNEQLDGVRQEMAALSADRAYLRALDQEGSVVVELVSEDGDLDARAVLTPQGSAYFRGVTLPELPEDRTYQLWGVTPDERVVSLGVLGADPDYEAFPVGDGRYVAFALTEEEQGGVAVSDQQPVVAGEVRA